MNYEYTPEDIATMNKLLMDYLRGTYYTSDLEDIPLETLEVLYALYNKKEGNEFVTEFCRITKKLPTYDGAYFKASRPVDSGYFSWGLIDLSWVEPNLVWMPVDYIEYHTNRLASGLIALKNVSVPAV